MNYCSSTHEDFRYHAKKIYDTITRFIAQKLQHRIVYKDKFLDESAAVLVPTTKQHSWKIFVRKKCVTTDKGMISQRVLNAQWSHRGTGESCKFWIYSHNMSVMIGFAQLQLSSILIEFFIFFYIYQIIVRFLVVWIDFRWIGLNIVI